MTPTALITGVVESISVTPDFLRLLIVFAFAYGAVLDYRTRRVYNEFWIPLIGLCFIVLAWDTALVVMESPEMTTEYLFSMGVSLIIVPSIGFTLWQADVFGGADLKALAFLSVFFPQVPEITFQNVSYPLTPGITSMFAITVLVNAVIIAFTYRVFLTAKNIAHANASRLMTRAEKCETNRLAEKHGDIVEAPNGRFPDRFDIDTLRMYLQWRGASIEALTSNAEFYKTTNPVGQNEMGDGSLPTTEKTPLGHSQAEFNPLTIENTSELIPIAPDTTDKEDPWAAEKFIEAATEEDRQVQLSVANLRTGLDTLAENEEVWVSPAIPFFIPLTIGLVVALTYGSLFVGGTEWIAELVVSLLMR